MAWPFSGPFAPLHEGVVEVIDGDRTYRWRLLVIDLGMLTVPSGRLLACDPFVSLPDGVVVEVPPGEYPVKVTVADVSDAQDSSNLREAYLSVILGEGEPVTHAPIIPAGQGPLDADAFHGVGVDGGRISVLDEVGARTLVPRGADYYDLFDTDKPDSWFGQADADSPLPKGYANIVLPLARNGENVVISESGWGDGFFPVIGAYGADGRLLSLHIDFQVVGDFTEPTAT